MTDAKRAGNYRYMAKCTRFEVRPLTAEGEQIKEAAANAGQSVQGYILQAIRERMEREQKESRSE